MSQDHELLTLLDLETLDTDLFRGFNPPHETRRIYGGQVVAQALAAASGSPTSTSPSRPPPPPTPP